MVPQQPADDGESSQLLVGPWGSSVARLHRPELRRDPDGDQVDDWGSYNDGQARRKLRNSESRPGEKKDRGMEASTELEVVNGGQLCFSDSVNYGSNWAGLR